LKKLTIFIALFMFISIMSCTEEAGIVSEDSIPRIAKKINAKLDNGNAELIAYYTEPLKPRHGESFKVVTFWKFNKKYDGKHKLFFHFEDENGERAIRKSIDRFFLDGRLKEIPAGKIIRDDANIKELPLSFDSSQLFIKTGVFKGSKRLVPEKKYNDGKNRLKLPVVETTKPKIVKKSIKVFAISGPSRKKIKIDGKLKESFWKNAQTGGKFWRTNGKKIADSQTEVMLAMDDKFLYVGFNVNDKDIYSPYKKNDDPIYNHDVVEVFIDANGDKNEYFELQVSPANIKFDKSFKGGPRKGGNVGWDSKMKFAVHLRGTLNKHDDIDNGWSAEMAIPFESITDAANNPPKDGDRWKAYIYRIDKSKDKSKSEYTAWIPPYAPDFHYLKFMGDFIFVYEEIM